MKKVHGPWIMIAVGAVLIVLNFIFASDEMDLGFWLRVLSSFLLMVTMYVSIQERKRAEGE